MLGNLDLGFLKKTLEMADAQLAGMQEEVDDAEPRFVAEALINGDQPWPVGDSIGFRGHGSMMARDLCLVRCILPQVCNRRGPAQAVGNGLSSGKFFWCQ